MTLKQPIFTHFCDKKERIVTDRLVYLLIWVVDSFTLWGLIGSYQEGK